MIQTNPTGSPVIDREQLLARMLGSAAMAGRMLNRFVENSVSECDLLESAIRMGDRESIRSLAHRHRGTAQTMASEPIAQVAGMLESDAAQAQTSQQLDLLDQLRSLHRDIEKYVSAEFPQSPPTVESHGEKS